MKAALDNFAPRLGAIYRMNEKTVLRTGYGITYNAQPWARALRGDNDYPVTVASTYQNADQFARLCAAGTGDSAARRSRHQQRNACGSTTPPSSTRRRLATSTAAWCRPGMRRSSAACRTTSRSMSPTSARRAAAAGRASTSTRRRRSASATRAGRMPRMGRIQPLWSWGQRLRTEYNSLQVAMNKPFTRGLLFKGAYTLSKSMNDNDAGRPGDARVEHAE